ncbi:MAG: BppU family phage baseplate upper protein [Ruminococcus sp.]|nr:BppU family phage baseplate upper protein [Ruminococcus sp.]
MEHTAKICADISCREAPPVIYSKQGDEGTRFVRVRFLDGGGRFDLSDAVETEIRVLKPDGKITITPGLFIGDEAVYPLTDQSLNVSGEGRAEFMLYSENGELISTVPARLMIAASPAGDEAAVSTNEFRALRERLTAVEGQLGGLTVSRLTQAEYDSITHDADTLYLVSGRSGLSIFLGDMKAGSGSGAPSVTAFGAMQSVSGTAVHTTVEEV